SLLLPLHSFPTRRSSDLSFDGDSMIGSLDIVMQITQHRIVFQKMRQRLRVGNIVDRDEVDVLVAQRGAKDVAADAAKSVDTHFRSEEHTSELQSRENLVC